MDAPPLGPSRNIAPLPLDNDRGLVRWSSGWWPKGRVERDSRPVAFGASCVVPSHIPLPLSAKGA